MHLGFSEISVKLSGWGLSNPKPLNPHVPMTFLRELFKVLKITLKGCFQEGKLGFSASGFGPDFGLDITDFGRFKDSEVVVESERCFGGLGLRHRVEGFRAYFGL